MDKIQSIMDKLRAFRQLPQPEYSKLAEILLEDLKNISAEIVEWKERYDIENSVKWVGTVMKLGDENRSMSIELNDNTYTISVSKTKLKK